MHPGLFSKTTAMPAGRATLLHATVFATFLAFAVASCRAAEIKVIGDSPLQPALTKVADVYSHDKGVQVILAFDPSPTVKKRIEEGETADVVIVQPDFMKDLAAAGKVVDVDERVIARVGVGLGNRAAGPAYDISSEEKLKHVLLSADMIVFNSVASGSTFAKALDALGIADTVKSKVIRTAPLGTFAPVLNGNGNDFVAATMPLIATTPGIKLLGPLPGALQRDLVYTTALMPDARERATAQEFVEFLHSSKAEQLFRMHGVTR